MENYPPGAENDSSAPYNEVEKCFDIEIEAFANVSVDLPPDKDEESFRENLAELIRLQVLKALNEFDVEHINVRVY